MKTVQLYEAKAHLSELIEDVQKGEEITIYKYSKAVAKLSSIAISEKRELGFYPIEFKNDFSAPSSQEVIDLLELGT